MKSNPKEWLGQTLATFMPIDRRWSLANKRPLLTQTKGTALFVDIAGFSLFAEKLIQQLGQQRGLETLSQQLNFVYNLLISQVHAYHGSVIGFVGDGITCWFQEDNGARGMTAAVSMQTAMSQFAHFETQGVNATLTIKIGVATGSAHRFLVGDPDIKQLDTLAGNLTQRMALAENMAEKGEIVLEESTINALANDMSINKWYTDHQSGLRFGVLADWYGIVPPTPWPKIDTSSLPDKMLQATINPPLLERLRSQDTTFLAEFRPTIPIFLKFSGLDYDHDPLAGDKLDQFIRRVQQVVGRYGGHLLQLTIGDKGSFLYINFGLLQAHDNNIERALLAALALQAIPETLPFITNTQIGIAAGMTRCGLNGSDSRRCFVATGDHVILAARLMSSAPPGEIYCTYNIYQSVPQQFLFKSLLPIRIKGKAEKIRVYQPLGTAPQRIMGMHKSQSFVGREMEKLQLASGLQKVTNGEGHILLIEGEAGIGKSHLLEQLLHMMQKDGVTGLRGTCHSTEQQTPYYAWHHLFETYFEIDDITELVAKQAQVQTVLSALPANQKQRIPLLNDMLDLGLPETELTRSFDANLRQKNLNQFLMSLLRVHANEQPLPLIIDDVHWLDSLSWEVLRNLARQIITFKIPILLVITTRTIKEQKQGIQSHLTWVQSLSNCQTISLQALGSEAIEAVSAEYLGLKPEAMPQTLIDFIQSRANGNPFFAIRLILTLQDKGMIGVENGRCRLTAPLAEIENTLPATIQGLIITRLDRLPFQAQSILKVASVLGYRFPHALLQHTVDTSISLADNDLPTYLQKLVETEFITIETTQPEPTYTFKHMLIQDATYQTLLFEQRHQVHRVVANWYEEQYAGIHHLYLPLLVLHYHHAEEWQKEKEYASLAGQKAAMQYAHEEAIRFLSRALELTDPTEQDQRYQLLLEREAVYHLMGKREAQVKDLKALARITVQDQKLDRRAEVLKRWGRLSNSISDYETAITMSQESVQLAQKFSNSVYEADGNLAWGIALYFQGQYEAAQNRLQTALSIAQANDLYQVAIKSLIYLGTIASHLDYFDQKERYITQALSLAQKEKDLPLESEALRNWGQYLFQERKNAQAITAVTQSLEIAQEIGDQEAEGRALIILALITSFQGLYEETRTYHDQALALMRLTGNRSSESRILNNMGDIAAEFGNLAQAEIYLRESLAIRYQIGDKLGEAWTLNGVGAVLALQGAHAKAKLCCEQALAISREIEHQYANGQILTTLGDILLEMGELDAALEALDEAISLRRQLSSKTKIIESLAAKARVYLRLNQTADAFETITPIIAYFEENGALLNVEKLLNTALTCYQVLQVMHSPKAKRFLQYAHDHLQVQLNQLTSERERRALVQNIPWNRTIITEWNKSNHTMLPSEFD